jgi:hypothetical protein
LCLLKGIFLKTHFASFVLRNFVLCVLLTLLRLRFSDEERMEKNCGPYLALAEGVPTLRKIDLAKCQKSFED